MYRYIVEVLLFFLLVWKFSVTFLLENFQQAEYIISYIETKIGDVSFIQLSY